jgi:hypothetical protein
VRGKIGTEWEISDERLTNG